MADRLEIQIVGVDRASGALKDVNNELGHVSKAASGLGDTLKTALTGALVGGGVAMAGIGAASVKLAADFEQTMSGIKAVSGASADEMARIQALTMQLGKDTAFSASAAGEGIAELIKGGVSIQDVMSGAAKSMLDLAAAGEVSLPDAAEIASNALAMFNLQGKDMAHVADLIAGAANASSLSVSDFKFSMSAAGSIAAATGQTFDDLAQAIAIMGKAGIKGSDAGTSLKTMLMNLQPTTKAQIEAFNQLGLTSLDTNRVMEEAARLGLDLSGGIDEVTNRMYKYVTGWKEGQKVTDKMSKLWDTAQKDMGLITNKFIDANGQFKGMGEIAGELQKALEGLTDAQKMQYLEMMFGSDAIRAAAIFAKAGAAGFEEMAGAMGKVTAASVGAEKLNNLNGSLEQMKGSLETAAITLGVAFLPAIRGVVDGATGMINAFIPWVEVVGPQIVATIQSLIGALISLVRYFGFVVEEGDTLNDFLADMPQSIRPIVLAFGEVVAWVRANWPLIQQTVESVMAAINKAVTAVMSYLSPFMLRMFGIVVDWTRENWPLIQQTVETVMAAIQAVVETVLAIVRDVWEAHGEEIMAIVSAMWTIIQTVVETAIRNVLDVLKLVMQIITGDWEGAWTTIQGILQRTWDAMLVLVGAALTILQTELGLAWEAIKVVAGVAWDGIKALIDTVWEGIQTLIGNALVAIQGALSTAWDGIQTKAGEALTALQTAIATAWQAISDTTGEMWQGIGSIIEGVWTGIKRSIRDSINWVIESINHMVDQAQGTINAITSFFGGTLDWSLPRLDNLPQFAQGGIVPGPVGMPQLILAHGGETVLPVGGVTNNYNLTANYRYQSERDLADDIRLLRMLGATT